MPFPIAAATATLPPDYVFGQNFGDLQPGLVEGVNASQVDGHLSVGLPRAGFIGDDPLANEYWFWFPEGVPRGKSLCVASSRLGQKLDQHDHWFDALRTVASRLDPADFFFVTASGTTTDVFVRRLGELFGFIVVEFVSHLSTNKAGTAISKSISIATKRLGAPRPIQTCYYQPRNQPDDSTVTGSSDDILIASASEVRLLSVRPAGNIYSAIRRRLKHSASGESKLLIDRQLTRKSVLDDLINAGAVGWWLYDATNPEPLDKDVTDHKNPCRPKRNVPILELGEFAAESFLLHWTRRRRGPWPDQTESAYLDDLIFQAHRRKHGELEALARLLATGRIMATNMLTRDQQPVVCFSNLPVTEIGKQKIFRQHLGRWDFSPYGIAVDRKHLFELGARPVIYGNETTWQNLSPEQRPFFQLATSKTGTLDWTQEQEWRLPGDLNLNQLPINAVALFVENADEAELISALSRWPIVVVGKSKIELTTRKSAP